MAVDALAVDNKVLHLESSANDWRIRQQEPNSKFNLFKRFLNVLNEFYRF